MTEADPKANILGHFAVQGVDHAGALKLDRKNTELQIYSEDFFHLKSEEMVCVYGVSSEGVSISALHCVPLTLTGGATYHDKQRHYMMLRPNFVVFGPRYLDPTARVITSISFGFSDATIHDPLLQQLLVQDHASQRSARIRQVARKPPDTYLAIRRSRVAPKRSRISTARRKQEIRLT